MRLVEFIRECLEIAEDQGVEELLAFATSAMREAPNGDAIIERVWEETGVALEVLSGVDESRVTFLAARRWFGWSSGRLLVIDIGGGSLELASGIDEDPDVAISLPLGAGRLTRERLPGDPRPRRSRVPSARTSVPRSLDRFGRCSRPPLQTAWSARPRRCVRWRGSGQRLHATADPSSAGAAPRGPRDDRRQAPGLDAAARVSLPGVSSARAHQMLAGALVAEAAMDLLNVDRLDICPWALREGLILRRLDLLDPDGEPNRPARTGRTWPGPARGLAGADDHGRCARHMDLARRPSGPCPRMNPMTIRIGLSTAAMYPDNAATAFATAARLGYDAVEVMVWTDPVTQEPAPCVR